MALSLQDRVDAYAAAFPKWPPPVVQQGRIYGIWLLGNDYRGSGLYGSFPPGFVKRVMALFPDAKDVMHLFSGSLAPGDYVRVDIREDADCDVRCDAHHLSLCPQWAGYSFDLIIADPPYSVEDADHYGTRVVNRNHVLQECWKVVKLGGCVAWFDQVLPMYSKKQWALDGVIGVVRSTNHRFRCLVLFRRLAGA